jgi:hypothetical protein
MVRTRLVLVNEQQTNSPPSDLVLDNCPALEDLAVSVTYQISDVREPENGIGSSSKTVNIPGTKEVNLFFENIFDVNISVAKFNPHLKVRAIYYVDELINFEGYLQINSIDVDTITGEKTYKCTILGEVLNLFRVIKGRYLTDLDYSSLNHFLDSTAIIGSWPNASTGVGIYYPIIDKGTRSTPPTFLYNKDFVGSGCIAARDFLLKIFTNAGYSWTSTFLDSNEFKSVRVTPTKIPQLSAAVLANNKFLANVTAPTTQSYASVFSSDPVYYYSLNTPTATTIINGTESYDAGGIHNAATGIFTVPITNNYNLSASFFLSYYLEQAAVEITGTAFQGNIAIQLVGTSTGFNQTLSLTSLTYGSANQNAFQVSLSNIPLVAGDQYYVRVSILDIGITRTSGANVATTLKTIIQSGAFSAEFTSNAPYTGQTVLGNDLIPENYLQDEFIKDLRKAFHLKFDVDKTNAKNLIIEPDPTFQLSTPENWDGKLDTLKPVEIYPVSDEIKKKFTFTYSDDADYFNKDYLDKFKETYGTHVKEITNDFVVDTSEVKLSVAPTPLVGNDYNGLVISSWRQQQNGVITQYKPKPRFLFAKNQVTNTSNAKPTVWTYADTVPPTVYTSFPYLGHMNDPFTPTQDLCFGFVDYLYYQFPAQTLTTNNLYNKYYSRYINQITDKNSKMVIAYFNLTPNDIFKFTFRKPIFTTINGEQGYYTVNKIDSYNPLVRQSTKVELLKLVDYAAFVPGTLSYVNGLGNSDDNSHSQNRAVNGNYVASGGSYTLGENTLIVGGSGNFIAEGANGIQLLNCTNVQVNSNVSDFVGIGLEDTTIDSTYTNTTWSAEYEHIILSTSTTLIRAYNNKTIYVDASLGDLTLTWDLANMEHCRISFIRTDSSANKVYLDSTTPYGTETFIGNAMPYDLATVGFVQYKAIPLTSLTDTIYVNH